MNSARGREGSGEQTETVWFGTDWLGLGALHKGQGVAADEWLVIL